RCCSRPLRFASSPLPQSYVGYVCRCSYHGSPLLYPGFNVFLGGGKNQKAGCQSIQFGTAPSTCLYLLPPILSPCRKSHIHTRLKCGDSRSDVAKLCFGVKGEEGG
ncbi:unnamed protein product, partial [Ectocarpus sp. 8 AP-2014]